MRSDALYNLACAYALQGKKDDALRALEEAVASGFDVRWHLANDPDLASIRGEARFQEILASL